MNLEEIKKHLTDGGFKRTDDLIHVFEGGSHQYGAALPEGSSDIDLYGVYVEPPVRALGVSDETHFTGGTADQYERNKPGDEDYKCYTLRRWAGLACKGNPAIIGFLYTSCTVEDGVWNELIVPNADLFKAKGHAKAFLGYAAGQVHRLDLNAPHGKHGQRPELQEKFGFDTKAAMHMIRLLFEAEEYMNTGKITYPRPEKDLLIAIRLGDYKLDWIFAKYEEMVKRVEGAMASSKLPDQVDREAISELITRCYIHHWLDWCLLDDLS